MDKATRFAIMQYGGHLITVMDILNRNTGRAQIELVQSGNDANLEPYQHTAELLWLHVDSLTVPEPLQRLHARLQELTTLHRDALHSVDILDMKGFNEAAASEQELHGILVMEFNRLLVEAGLRSDEGL